MIKKYIAVPVITAAIVGVTWFGTSTLVHAQSNGKTTLVQMIAQKFGLDQSQVQAVFDQYQQQNKAAMQQNMRQGFQKRLDKAVAAGEITSAQEQSILAEQKKLQSEYPFSSLKNMTPAQRKQQFQNEQNEIKAWAQANGVAASYLMPGFGRMHRGGWMKKPKGSLTPTP